MSHLFRVVTAITLSMLSTSADASVLSNWNLIVRHDLSNTSQVQGSALIGGNLSGTSNYATRGGTAVNGDGLVIGGDITGNTNVQINNGANLRLSGSVQAGSHVNLNGGGVQLYDAGVSTMIDDAFIEIEAISSSLGSLAANGALDQAGNLTATPTLIDGQNVAVYNLTNDDIHGLGQLNLSMGSADTVIINLFSDNGVIDMIAPPNIIGGFNQNNSSRILWNLPDATTVSINNSLSGALLAPYADLALLGGGINGSVAVNSFSNMRAEIRSSTYSGYLPATGTGIPEPSSLVLLSLCALLGFRRR